jgi:hypothetical protein
MLQRRSETPKLTVLCLFSKGFRDNPAQGKSTIFRLHARNAPLRRIGTRLPNLAAGLTTQVELCEPSQICNREL